MKLNVIVGNMIRVVGIVGVIYSIIYLIKGLNPTESDGGLIVLLAYIAIPIFIFSIAFIFLGGMIVDGVNKQHEDVKKKNHDN